MIEILVAFLVGLCLGRSSSGEQHGTQIRNPHPMPTHRPDPPPAPPSKVFGIPIVTDDSLGPDQWFIMNTRQRPGMGGGWPT